MIDITQICLDIQSWKYLARSWKSHPFEREALQVQHLSQGKYYPLFLPSWLFHTSINNYEYIN